MTEKGTHFLNVDLDIASRRDPAPLLAALDPHVVVLHTRKEGRLHHAGLELYEFSRYKDADACVAAFARIVATLPVAARRLWEIATVRNFDIGIQAGAKGGTFKTTIKPATLSKISELSGTIAITVYPPESPRATVPRTGRRKSG